MKRIFIVGYGDIGRRVAKLCLNQGASVFAMGRQAVSSPQTGINYIQANLDQPASLDTLPSAAALIYYFAPPPQQGENDPRLEHFLASIAPDKLPERIVYISTSGVYGDCKGAWVTETTPVAPQTERAKRRLAAEQTLSAWAEQHQVAYTILRVGGIYGPGRLPLDRIRQGMSVLRRDEAPFSNRIHADDLAAVCAAAANAPNNAVYNVSDNEPSTMSDYFIAVAKHAGLPLPSEIGWSEAEAQLSPAMLSYLHESRRMDNGKLLRELNITLTYPTLQQGLAACFSADQ